MITLYHDPVMVFLPIFTDFAIFPAESFSEEVKKALGKSYNEVRQECKIKLTSNDDLYSNLRHLHVTAVGSYVKRQLTEISTYFSVSRLYYAV